MPCSLTTTGTMVFDRVPQCRVSDPHMPVESSAASDTPRQRRTAWMVAAQAGDRRAYERLLADSIALIRAAARRSGVASDHVDDVVQETLLTVHRVRHTFAPARSYDTWLAAIAQRRAIDASRRRARRDRRE